MWIVLLAFGFRDAVLGLSQVARVGVLYLLSGASETSLMVLNGLLPPTAVFIAFVGLLWAVLRGAEERVEQLVSPVVLLVAMGLLGIGRLAGLASGVLQGMVLTQLPASHITAVVTGQSVGFAVANTLEGIGWLCVLVVAWWKVRNVDER